jgi:hypothetical protein
MEARLVTAKPPTGSPGWRLCLASHYEGVADDKRLLQKRGGLMKIALATVALATAAVLTLLSIAGCAQYVGKGKSPSAGHY